VVAAYEKEVDYEPELELELDLAAAFFITPHFTVG
jgi:hypothetical protein